MEKLLAADIGGSKTRIILLDVQGKVLLEADGAGVAAVADSTEPIPCLEKQLESLENKEDVCAIAINLGGKNKEQVSLCFRKFFPKVPLKIFRESEGTAAFALGEKHGSEIILMAGTGAIAVGKQNGSYVITGGWGANVGDGGSGYDIGLQAIRKTLSALDGECEMTPLTEYLSGRKKPLEATKDPVLYTERRDEVRKKLGTLDRRNIASVTKTVAEFAEKGDRTAIGIFEYAGEKLAELVVCSARKLNKNSLSCAIVTGGLIHTRKFWEPSFDTRIKTEMPHLKISYIKDGVLEGTCIIAKELYKNKGDI